MPCFARLPVDDELRKVELREHVAGLPPQLRARRRRVDILLHIAAIEQHQRILELRFRNALLGGQRIPFRRLNRIARHAEPARQYLGDQRLRGGIAVPGACKRQIVGSDIEAALKGRHRRRLAACRTGSGRAPPLKVRLRHPAAAQSDPDSARSESVAAGGVASPAAIAGEAAANAATRAP